MADKFQVTYSATAFRALSEQLPPKIAKAAFIFIEGPLAENPKRVGQQLRGRLHPHYCARRGNYRIIYEIQDQDVVIRILKIDHSANAHRPD